MGWDPWEHLTDARVIETECSEPGLYFPADRVIVLAAGQTRAMSRSALAHELGHHELGHWPHPDPGEVDRMEERARRWAAIRLVSIGDVLEALRSADSLFDVAEELGVDPELLELRLKWLSEDERRDLGWYADQQYL